MQASTNKRQEVSDSELPLRNYRALLVEIISHCSPSANQASPPARESLLQASSILALRLIALYCAKKDSCAKKEEIQRKWTLRKNNTTIEMDHADAKSRVFGDYHAENIIEWCTREWQNACKTSKELEWSRIESVLQPIEIYLRKQSTGTFQKSPWIKDRTNSLEQLLSDLYEQSINWSLSNIDREEKDICVIEDDFHRRKRAGAYYSPPRLVRRVVRQTLDQYAADNGKTLKNKSLPFSPRIIDPSMGSGTFLIESLKEILGRIKSQGCEENNRKSILARDIALACLHGVDLDPVAVAVARLRIWLFLEDQSIHPDFLDCNLKAGNSLTGKHNRKSEFSWQKEFPQIFLDKGLAGFDPGFDPGFDIVIGNPPWESEKPDSREFFSRFDKSFRRLSKKEALHRQEALLASDPRIAALWRERLSIHKSLSLRIKRGAFSHQGGVTNLYKLFLEQSYELTRENGLLALILPAGIYSDHSAFDLRNLLLEHCRWLYLVGLSNTDQTFGIHRSFKYCYLIAAKGGPSKIIRTCFDRNFTELERADTTEWLDIEAGEIEKFSPRWRMFPETDSKAKLALLQKLQKSKSTLGECRIGFSTSAAKVGFKRQFDMTLDSQFFINKEQAQSNGYIQDIYGNWLKGDWQAAASNTAITCLIEAGMVPSASGGCTIALQDIEDILLPLYEGRMLDQFDFNAKGWQSGKGRSAIWQPTEAATTESSPQYLLPAQLAMNRAAKSTSTAGISQLKIGYLAVGSPTNARTMIACALSRVPCGNSVPVIDLETTTSDTISPSQKILALSALMNSLAFDFSLRARMTGNNLNYFILEECPLPEPEMLDDNLIEIIASFAAALTMRSVRYAAHWLEIEESKRLAPITDAGRARHLHALIDALSARAYGLTGKDLETILDMHPLDRDRRSSKGFHRVDKDLPTGERLPALLIDYFAQIESAGELSQDALLALIPPGNQLSGIRASNLESVASDYLGLHAQCLNKILNKQSCLPA